MTKERFFLIAMLLVWAHSSQAGLIAYNDRAAFESSLLPGFQIEDFEDNRATAPVTIFPEGLNRFSNNAAFAPESIVPRLNLFAFTGHDLVLLNRGFRGLDSAAVAVARFSDDIAVQIPNGGSHALGLDYRQLNVPNAALAGRIAAVSETGALLGRFDLTFTNEAQFFGVVSTDTPISAFFFFDVDIVGEVVDNITFGTVVPEPHSALAFVGLFGIPMICGRSRRSHW